MSSAEEVLDHTDAFDVVARPSHYNQAGIECIDAIEAALTAEEFRGYLKGNVLKYTWRERYKNGIEDIKKFLWYGNRLCQFVEKISCNYTAYAKKTFDNIKLNDDIVKYIEEKIAAYKEKDK